jgi:hypothetical protein
MYYKLNTKNLSRAERSERLMAACHTEIRLRQCTVKRINKQIEIEARRNPIDQRLNAIIGEDQEIGGGMAGAAQIFLKMVDPSSYKKAAARHLIGLRHLRRWFLAHKGERLSMKKHQEILGKAAFCRRRAAGLEPMPKVLGLN